MDGGPAAALRRRRCRQRCPPPRRRPRPRRRQRGRGWCWRRGPGCGRGGRGRGRDGRGAAGMAQGRGGAGAAGAGRVGARSAGRRRRGGGDRVGGGARRGSGLGKGGAAPSRRPDGDRLPRVGRTRGIAIPRENAGDRPPGLPQRARRGRLWGGLRLGLEAGLRHAARQSVRGRRMGAGRWPRRPGKAWSWRASATRFRRDGLPGPNIGRTAALQADRGISGARVGLDRFAARPLCRGRPLRLARAASVAAPGGGGVPAPDGGGPRGRRRRLPGRLPPGRPLSAAVRASGRAEDLGLQDLREPGDAAAAQAHAPPRAARACCGW